MFLAEKSGGTFDALHGMRLVTTSVPLVYGLLRTYWLDRFSVKKYHKLFNLPLPQPDPIPDTKGYIIQKINKK